MTIWNLKCGVPLMGDVREILAMRYSMDDHEKFLNRTKEDVLLGSKHREYGTLLREYDTDDFIDDYEEKLDTMISNLNEGKIVEGFVMKEPLNFTEAMEKMLAEPIVMMGYICDRPLYFRVDAEGGHKVLMFCSFNPKEQKDVSWMPVMHILDSQDLSKPVWFEVE